MSAFFWTEIFDPYQWKPGQGLQLVHRHRFLFQRFRPQRYYYGLLLLLRNAMLALFPVIFTPVPSLQIEIMGFVLLTASALQIRLWPWRTELANYTDLAINLLLQILLLGVSPLVSRDAEKSTVLLGYLLSFAVLSPFIAGLVVISHAIWRHFIPPSLFGVFLCHHKARFLVRGYGMPTTPVCVKIRCLIKRDQSFNRYYRSTIDPFAVPRFLLLKHHPNHGIFPADWSKTDRWWS